MADFLAKCLVCRALLDEEDLFCANCGTEAPRRAAEPEPPRSTTLRHHFACSACGASMSYDAEVGRLRCPFCGSSRVEKEPDVKMLKPEAVVPFRIARAEAEAALRQWLGNGFWRPGDVVREARVTEMTPVFVPYWVFRAETFTYWTADSSLTPAGARGDWFPLHGERYGRYDGLLVGASSVLTPAETEALCPFNLEVAVAPERLDTQGYVVEQFRVPRKYARPLARQGLEAREASACAQDVPGRCRNLKVNVRLEALASRPVLVPVWVMAYRYRNQVYRFLMNGQTGRTTGHAPFAWGKLWWLVAIVAAVVLVFFLLALAARSAHGASLPATPVVATPARPGGAPPQLMFSGRAGYGIVPAGTKLTPVHYRVSACLANRFCRRRPPKVKTNRVYVPSGSPMWSDSATLSSGCGLPSRPRDSVAMRWGTCCWTGPPVWARPPWPAAFRRNSTRPCRSPAGRSSRRPGNWCPI